jgi:hypothetical protein
MRSTRRAGAAVALLACLGLAGCGTAVDSEHSFTMKPADPHKIIEVGSPSKDQKVQVSVTSDQPVNAFVILNRDFDEKELETIGSEEAPKKALKFEKKTKDSKMEVDVPSGQKFKVFVWPAAGTRTDSNINVKIKSL